MNELVVGGRRGGGMGSENFFFWKGRKEALGHGEGRK